DADAAAHGLPCDQPRQILQLALGAAALDPAVDDGRDAGRIVAAIFEPLQAVDEKRANLTEPDDADDSAHGETALPLGYLSEPVRALVPPPDVVCRRARKRLAPSATTRSSPRSTASASFGTLPVIVLPAPTMAPSPTVTGATSEVLEPMKAPSPISVKCLA